MMIAAKIAEKARWYDGFRVKAVLESGDFGFWYLEKPGTRMGSVLVSATPEGLVLSGDGHHGPGNATGTVTARYGLRWFLGDLSPSYLAEKCIRPDWHAAIAAANIREELENARSDAEYDVPNAAMIEMLEALLRNEDHLRSADAFYSALGEVAWDTADDLPHDDCERALRCALGDDEWYEIGAGYDPEVVAWLSAVQRAFKAGWNKRMRPAEAP